MTAQSLDAATSPRERGREGPGPGLTPRSLLLAAAFLFVGALWIRKTSLLAFTILVGEGTPPVPAMAALVLMAAVGVLFTRLTVTPRWRREGLLIYLLLSCAYMTIDANGVRQLFASLTSLHYFAAPGNDYAVLGQTIPAWLMPHDDALIRGFYEGVDGGAVPWAGWMPILIVWGGAFMVLSLSLGCMVSLFRAPWAEDEHLTFPLAELALSLAPDPQEQPGRPWLLKSWLFWVGFAVAAAYDGSNIAHAFMPGIKAIGQSFDLSPLLSERPWSALRPLNLAFRPEIVGLGYLVPKDVLLSVWALYLFFRVENFLATLFGYTAGAGFPHDRAQGMGAYIGLGLFTLYAGRHHLLRAFQAAVGRGADDNASQHSIPPAVAVWGVIIGFLALTALMVAGGMAPLTALSYVALIYLCTLAYSRVRAQTGLPITYGMPREEMYETVLYLQPTNGHLSDTAVRNEGVFALFQTLSRMTFGQLAANQLEGFHIARRSDIRRSHLLGAIILGLLGGLLLGYAIHLLDSYNYGWNILDGGSTEGGYRTRQALTSYSRMQSRVHPGEPLTPGTSIARGVGLALAVLMLWLRAKYLRFPLNPVGLALAGTFGSPIWFAVFMAWLAKTIVLRLGGAHAFRQLTPAFLGLAIGHFLIAGGIWGIVGAVNEEVATRYLLWFA